MAKSASSETHESASQPGPVAVRPRSAVSAGVGIVGLGGLVSYLLIARFAPEIAAFLGVDWGDRGAMNGPNSAIASVLACGGPMGFKVANSLFVYRLKKEIRDSNQQ